MQETQKKPWYEDESFWRTFESTMFDRERLGAAAGEIEQIIELLDVEKGARMLDLCCGIGRHSLELARRGYQVVGVDLTEEYLAKARRQAETEHLNVEFIRSDMRRFCLPEGFDAVINMFTAFGYFQNPDDDKRVLTNIYRSLREGGKLIIDVMGKEVLARIFQRRRWEEQDGRILLCECKLCRNWSWAENRWILLEGGDRREFRFGHRIYSAVELSGLLTDCGFSCVSVHGDLSGVDYDDNAKRLIAVAIK